MTLQRYVLGTCPGFLSDLTVLLLVKLNLPVVGMNF